MPKQKLTESDKAEIIEKYNNGANIHHLSKQYLIDRSCIRIVLAHAGIVPRVTKSKPTAPRIRKNIRASRPTPLKKGFYLWHDDDKKMPLSYAEYAKRKGVNLKKYFISHGLTREEKLNNQSGNKFF